jgi:hypothetical protein
MVWFGILCDDLLLNVANVYAAKYGVAPIHVPVCVCVTVMNWVVSILCLVCKGIFLRVSVADLCASRMCVNISQYLLPGEVSLI